MVEPGHLWFRLSNSDKALLLASQPVAALLQCDEALLRTLLTTRRDEIEDARAAVAQTAAALADADTAAAVAAATARERQAGVVGDAELARRLQMAEYSAAHDRPPPQRVPPPWRTLGTAFGATSFDGPGGGDPHTVRLPRCTWTWRDGAFRCDAPLGVGRDGSLTVALVSDVHGSHPSSTPT